MSGTRASTIRQNIVDAIKAVTLDQQAGSGDRFLHLNVSRRPDGGARDRSFRVFAAAPPARDDLQTADAFRVEFTVEIYYALANAIDDRVCDDLERFWWSLETLQSRNSGINISDPAPLGIEEGVHNWIVRVSVIVRYRLDSTLIA